MKTKLITLTLLLATSIGFAKEVQFIRKGALAPYDGYIFDADAERDNRSELMQKDNMAAQIHLFKENEKLYEGQVNLWKGVATENTERLVRIQDNSFWRNTLFFGLGVLATGALAIGLSKGLNR